MANGTACWSRAVSFGMLADKFGVPWMVNVTTPML